MHSSWCLVVTLVIAVAQGAPDRPASPSSVSGYLDAVVFLDDDQPNRTPKANDESLLKADEYSTYEESDDEQGRVTYIGAQVWNVAIDNNDRLRIVGNLTRHQEVAAWGGDHNAVDFMIKPHKLERVSKVLQNNDIPYSVVIPDLQQYIDNENPPLSDEETELQERKARAYKFWNSYRIKGHTAMPVVKPANRRMAMLGAYMGYNSLDDHMEYWPAANWGLSQDQCMIYKHKK